jgi:hypothetical protein
MNLSQSIFYKAIRVATILLIFCFAIAVVHLKTSLAESEKRSKAELIKPPSSMGGSINTTAAILYSITANCDDVFGYGPTNSTIQIYINGLYDGSTISNDVGYFTYGIRGKVQYGVSYTISAEAYDAYIGETSLSGCGTAPQSNPIGPLDRISTDGVAWGWAIDPDVSSQSIDVHFYVDGPAGSGFWAGSVTANIPRPDVNTGTGYPGDHGFRFTIPVEFRDGKTHTLYAHAIDVTGGTNVILNNSPLSFTFALPAPAPAPTLYWSSAGPIAGKHCISVNEPSDPHTWNDNYLCTDRDYGFKWSYVGLNPGMYNIRINEPSDPHMWYDNYLGTPIYYGYEWSYGGPIANKQCVQIAENSDPHTWNDNYICWTPAPTPTPTLSPTPTPSSTPTPTPQLSGSVWVEDALPSGSIPMTEGGDAWTWMSSSPSPFSGSYAHQSNIYAGFHQHYFTDAKVKLQVDVGDYLYAYVYLDPANMPTEIMLQWRSDTEDWEHRAYWGGSSITWGTDGTPSRRYIGPLPEAGKWVRLEVAASQVGLEGKLLNGMAFTLYGGRATWDQAGKTAGSTAPTIRITSPTNNSTVGNSVTIQADAKDGNGTISKVEFYQGSTKIGESTASPYQFTWTGVANGTYTLKAKATDNDGLSTTSSAVTCTVGTDSDNDGLPDDWEMKHFGNLSQSANGDADGDGVSNKDEYLLGRNPTKGVSPNSINLLKLYVFNPLEGLTLK